MNSQKVFGVFDSAHCLIDTSTTLRGAMIHARKNGCYRVGVRFVMSGNVFELAKLVNNKWVRTQYGLDSSYTN